MQQYPSTDWMPLVAEKEYLLVTLDFLLDGGDVSATATLCHAVPCRSIRARPGSHRYWQGYTMLKGAREVRLDWPVSNAVLKPMRDATIASNLTGPTQDMLLANLMQRQALTAVTTDTGLDGRIRKIIGSVDESMDSSACCKQQCRLGRSARPLGCAICPRRRAFPTKAFPANMRRLALDAAGTASAARFGACRWAALAQLRNSSLKSSDLPMAVLLPCTAFGGTLAKGVVTDFDLRRTILSAQEYRFG